MPEYSKDGKRNVDHNTTNLSTFTIAYVLRATQTNIPLEPIYINQKHNKLESLIVIGITIFIIGVGA